jgi:hypothetical protein
LAALSLRPQRGAQSSSVAARVSGQSYDFEENEDGISKIKFDFGQEGTQITVHDHNGEHHFAAGYQQWLAGVTSLGQEAHDPAPFPIAVSGAWTEDDTIDILYPPRPAIVAGAATGGGDSGSYAIRMSFTETPFIPLLTFRFVDNRLEYRKRYNVGFGPPEELERPTVVGILA